MNNKEEILKDFEDLKARLVSLKKKITENIEPEDADDIVDLEDVTSALISFANRITYIEVITKYLPFKEEKK